MQTAPAKARAGCEAPAPTAALPQSTQLGLMASKCCIHTFLQHFQSQIRAAKSPSGMIHLRFYIFSCHSPQNQGLRGWASPGCVSGLSLCGYPSPVTPPARAVPGGRRVSPTEWCLWVCASSRYRPCLWSSSILEEGRDQSGMTAHSRYLGHTKRCFVRKKGRKKEREKEREKQRDKERKKETKKKRKK